MSLFRKKKKRVIVGTYDSLKNDIRIMQDSLRLIDETLNPETYFSRYKLASNKAIESMESKEPAYKGMTPGQIYRMLRDQKDELHKQFIDRLFKAGREDSLAYQMRDVGLSMSQDVRDYYVQKLNGKTFHFCKVRFDADGKEYTYITKDSSLEIGDTVTVPTGNKFVPDSTVLQVTDLFEKRLDQLPFPLEKLRCVERKLRSIKCPHCGAGIKVDVGEKTGKCDYCQAEFYLL